MAIHISYARLPGWVRRVLDRKGDYRVVFMDTPAGRRVLADLLAETGMDHNHDPFVPGQSDTTFRNLGRQEIGRHILRQINIPDAEIVRLATRNKQEKEDPDYVPDRYQTDD